MLFQKSSPEGRLNHETYVYTFWHNTNNSQKNWICIPSLSPQWAQFWEPWQALKDWKEKIQGLQQQFEEFWEQKNLQRGATAEGRRPLCRFLRDPKLFRLVLKSSIFSFQSFRACQGSQNWAHWRLSKKEYKIPFVRRINELLRDLICYQTFYSTSPIYIESRKAIYDIGAEILCLKCFGHKPIKNQTSEKKGGGFLKLSTRSLILQ